MIELISIHIPKTAGRSFLAILKSVYGEDNVAHFDWKTFPKRDEAAVSHFKSELDEKIKVIHGHLSYKEIIQNGFSSHSKFITWLRNPVQRVISNYNFFKKRISKSGDPALLKRENETLLEYSHYENGRNRMTKFIAGLQPEKFYYIGIMENFEEDIQELGRMLHWPSFQIPRINVSDIQNGNSQNVTEEEIKIIEELNVQDVELYNRVLDIRSKRLR
jgi:hypothetical protein